MQVQRMSVLQGMFLTCLKNMKAWSTEDCQSLLNYLSSRLRAGCTEFVRVYPNLDENTRGLWVDRICTELVSSSMLHSLGVAGYLIVFCRLQP